MSAVRAFAWAMVATLFTACAASVPPRPAPLHVTDTEQLVGEYYRRMNAEDLAGVLALMVPEPVLTEPFTREDAPTVHRGYASVAGFFQGAFRTRDDVVIPEYVRTAGERVTVGWSLTSADGVAMSGVTRLLVRGGQIAEVEIEGRQ